MALIGENRTYPAYTELRRIPGGANGLIHVGKHTARGIECVQKTYDRPGRDDAIAFFEPRLLHEIDHPNIVEIFDAQPDRDRDDAITMVMPYYTGGDLNAHLAKGIHLSVGQVVEFLTGMASALDYLHSTAHLLHRDVKPKNMLVESEWKLVLCDFGSAAKMSSTGHTAAVRATVPYQPPEVMRLGHMTAASDIYSLGLSGIEMLDGRPLWSGRDIANMTARVDKGLRAYPAAALASSARSPHVPSALRAILARCVAEDPAVRPSAAQLASQLQRLSFVDWRHLEGQDLDGRWEGTWPGRARADRAIHVEIVSQVMRRGPKSGSRRLTCSYHKATSGAWRSLGSDISPTDLDTHDAAAVSKFFRTVSARIAQRFPA